MAEQIFADHLRRNKCLSMADVSSAGIFADNGRSMTAEAVGVLSEMGMTIKPHKSRRITVDILQNADVIVCMGEDILGLRFCGERWQLPHSGHGGRADRRGHPRPLRQGHGRVPPHRGNAAQHVRSP